MSLDELRAAAGASYDLREGIWRPDTYLVALLVYAERAETARLFSLRGYSVTEYISGSIPVSSDAMPTISQGVS